MEEGVKSTKRIGYLDIAKGFSMICIVMGHLGIGSLNAFVYTFHVPIFFLISGYFLSDKLSVSEFAKKKARQLLVPYVVTSCCIIVGATLRDVLETGSLENVVYDIKTWTVAALYGSGTIEYQEPFYMKQIGAIWFLLALFFALLIVRFAMQYQYGFAGVIILAYVGYKTTTMVWLPWSIQAGMTAAVFVYIGLLARKGRVLERKPHPAIISVAAGIWLVCILFGGHLYIVRNHFENGFLDVIGALAGSYIVILLCEKLEKYTNCIARFLKFLGKNSLFFLCCHALELQAIPWQFVWTVFGEKLKLQTATVVTIWVCLRVVLCSLGVLVCLQIKKFIPCLKEKWMMRERKVGKWNQNTGKDRIKYWNIAKGIAILLMILGHAEGIPAYLRTIIFSFHMPLLIIANGYFIKSYDIKRTFKKSVKSLLVPYMEVCLISAVIYTVVAENGSAAERFLYKIKAMLGGMSKISTRFESFDSVWLVWFVCCLFVTRNLYVILMKLLENYSSGIRLGVLVLLAFAGYVVGKYYAFLPWSLDVALVSLLFMAVGDWLRRNKFFETNGAYKLAIPAAVWIYFLTKGICIELATRSYPLGIWCIVEAVAGSLTVISLSQLLSRYRGITNILSWIGQNTMLILALHCLEMMYFNWNDLVFSRLPFEMNWFRIFVIKTAVILAVTAGINMIKRRFVKSIR